MNVNNDPHRPSTPFNRPNLIDRAFNRAFGLLLRFGIGFAHNDLLEVRGRKSGRIYSTPVNLLELGGKRYLVAPRGYTQWVRNVLANGEASLVKRTRREEIRLKAIPDEEKAKILKAYLDRYRRTVQQYFPVKAGSPLEAFQPLAVRYPVFEVTAKQ
jgi:deazaflavin-dependent oxidoreductase (nitroreductase family)